MKAVGITAEYNPFHNGHKYNIEKAKELTGSDCAVIVMSGDFVERGCPAVTDKFTRTRCALSCGADLVIELPAVFATGSAELFALGAVGIMNGLGGIDNIAFGCEDADDGLNKLSEAAELLSDEPYEYRALLTGFISDGLSMPAAREKAVVTYTGDPSLGEMLSKPNNILAIEYMKALRVLKSNISPRGIARKGAGYNEISLSSEFASATGIRKALEENNIGAVCSFIPAEAFHILEENGTFKHPVNADDFSSILHYALLTSADKLNSYSDVGTPLANKIRNVMNTASFHHSSFRNLAIDIKSSDITYTRICRALIHILLGITADDISDIRSESCNSYARVLGFNDTGRSFLSSVKKKSRIPIISNCKDDSKILSRTSERIFQIDRLASDIYNRVILEKSGRIIKDDFRAPVIKM